VARASFSLPGAFNITHALGGRRAIWLTILAALHLGQQFATLAQQARAFARFNLV
jgi:hypothetical protein